MTWPTTPISTEHLDAGTDSPASARADLKSAVDNINAVAAEFDDVDTTGKSTGDTLTWDGSRWAPSTPATVPTELDDLSDVDLTTPPTDGQALVWSDSSSAWQAGTVSGGGGGSIAILNFDTTINLDVAGRALGLIDYYDPDGLLTMTNAGTGSYYRSFQVNTSGTYFIETLGPWATAGTTDASIDLRYGTMGSEMTAVSISITNDDRTSYGGSNARFWIIPGFVATLNSGQDHFFRYSNDTYSVVPLSTFPHRRIKITKLA